MPRNVSDLHDVPEPHAPETADVVAFPTQMAKAVGSVEGIHVEVHVASHQARAATALIELGHLACDSPDGDVLMRIAIGADLLTSHLVLEGIRCVGIAIGTSLTTGGHAGSAEFAVAESSATSAVVIDHEGNRSAVATSWERDDEGPRTALTVRSDSAVGCLTLARQARERPGGLPGLFSTADADGWFIYPDGRIENCV